MKIGRSSNPALGEKIFQKAGSFAETGTGSMSINGAINKTGVLTIILLLTGAFSWANASTTFMWIGIIGGLIAAVATIFKPHWSPWSAPLYAAFEGLALGTISAIYASLFEGIVSKAILLTFSILFVMLFAYRSGLVKATEKFKSGVVAATGGVAVFYLITMAMSFFGADTSAFFGGGLLSIGISLVIIVIAALNLVLDFDFIEKGAAQGLPKYFEWYGGFGLMVTLVWLYLEILRLLSYLTGSD